MTTLARRSTDQADWRLDTPSFACDWANLEPANAEDRFLIHAPILTFVREPYIAGCGDLLQKAVMDALTLRSTASPMVFYHAVYAAPAVLETAAQSMVTELRQLSGLTTEEIAPLLGVTRRGVQKWVAGEAISARKEGRLRSVLDAVREISAIAGAGATTRSRLLNRPLNTVAPADLIAEGRFVEAVDAALERRSAKVGPERAESATIAAQMDQHQDSFDTPGGPLNRKLSGIVRR